MARCPKPFSTVKAGREKLLTIPATKLLFEILDQIDQDQRKVVDSIDDTHFIDRCDKVAIFDTLLARSIEHRLAPVHASGIKPFCLNFGDNPPVPRHPEGIKKSDK
jgi:hypothetical protein